MDTEPAFASRLTTRKILLTASGFLCVLLAPHVGVPMVLYPVLGLALVAALLRYQGLGFSDIDFRWRAMKVWPLLIGGLLGILYATINYLAIGPLIAYILNEGPDLTAFNFVRTSLSGFVIALVLALVIGGVYEELLFRGFLRDFLVRHLPAWRMRPLVVAVLVALIFAAYHWQLGSFGVANAFVFAAFAAVMRQAWPTNLWYVISFHALADMSAFTLMRMGLL